VIARRGVLDTGIEFLAKPFTPSSLVARVRAILDAR
jgi:DNA-binding response OmpR family regulator